MNSSDTPGLLTDADFDRWATDMAGPVALRLKQKLLPLEDSGIIFPPTYADIGYNIDTLSDGTRVATIDSVGSQANRLEPIFKAGTEESSPTLRPLVDDAFQALRRRGDAGPLCALAPTSLVFGVWDSRGDSGEKRPRLVRSIIRAWDIEPLHAAAQFNSVWKALNEDQKQALENEAKAKKTKLSEKGFSDAPAVFRKVGKNAAKYIREFRDGSPNPERRVLGGVIARGPIERDVTVNLVALRGLRGTLPGSNNKNKPVDASDDIRKYLLGLSLVTATADVDLFLREGCLLRYAETGDTWFQVPRRGDPTQVTLGPDAVQKYAEKAVKVVRQHWLAAEDLKHDFDLVEAKKLLAKKTAEEAPE